MTTVAPKTIRLTEPRHVHVLDVWSGVTARPPSLGLLLEWRRAEDGRWWGLVAHVRSAGLQVRLVLGSELRPLTAGPRPAL